MEKQLEEHLRSFHSSREFKMHSISREGRFWRVLVLCRQVRDATAEIQSEVMPVLTEIATEETTKMIFNQRKQIAQVCAVADLSRSIPVRCPTLNHGLSFVACPVDARPNARREQRMRQGA